MTPVHGTAPSTRPRVLVLTALAVWSFTAPAFADDEVADMIREATSTRAFVVIASTRDYAMALNIARDAHKRLGYALNLRGLKPHPEIGLTFSRTDCGQEYPCYAERGLSDGGVFISIERSAGYATFKPGYFLVVVADGSPDESELKAALAKAKLAYPSAFMRNYPLYVGCRH